MQMLLQTRGQQQLPPRLFVSMLLQLQHGDVPPLRPFWLIPQLLICVSQHLLGLQVVGVQLLPLALEGDVQHLLQLPFSRVQLLLLQIYVSQHPLLFKSQS